MPLVPKEVAGGLLGGQEVADEYEQIDFNVSWRATDNLVFTLEGINLTEEPIIYRGRSENQVQAYFETDTRLMLGARYTFGD